jgi:hypothetical protein
VAERAPFGLRLMAFDPFLDELAISPRRQPAAYPRC